MQIAADTVWILIHPASERKRLSLCTTMVGARKLRAIVMLKWCISEIDLAASQRYELLAASVSLVGTSDGGWTFPSVAILIENKDFPRRSSCPTRREGG